MPKFNVVLFPVVSVKFEGIEADTPEKAMERAEAISLFHDLFDRNRPSMRISYTEFAEEFSHAVVQEGASHKRGDTDRWYEGDFKTPSYPGKKDLIIQDLLELPLSDMPKHINSPQRLVQDFAKFRLLTGR